MSDSSDDVRDRCHDEQADEPYLGYDRITLHKQNKATCKSEAWGKRSVGCWVWLCGRKGEGDALCGRSWSAQPPISLAISTLDVQPGRQLLIIKDPLLPAFWVTRYVHPCRLTPSVKYNSVPSGLTKHEMMLEKLHAPGVRAGAHQVIVLVLRQKKQECVLRTSAGCTSLNVHLDVVAFPGSTV
jgi:hypothetical protein